MLPKISRPVYVVNVTLALFALCSTPGCGLLQPTYVDVNPATIAAIAHDLNITVDELLTSKVNILQEVLSRDIGLQITGIAAEFAEVENGQKELTSAVAEIQIARDAAAEALTKEVVKNPGDASNWIKGALAAAGILAAGALGLRGRKTPKKPVPVIMVPDVVAPPDVVALKPE